MEVKIIKAAPADAAITASIGRRTFYETWRSVNTEEDLQLYINQSFNPEKIREDIQRADVNTFLLVFVGDELAGYVKLRNDRSYPQLKGKLLELERIYVLKEFQAKKIGKTLMDESIRIAKSGGYDCLWLGVNEENFKAINFYESYGFEVFGSKQFVLGTAVDTDLLMQRKIKALESANE